MHRSVTRVVAFIAVALVSSAVAAQSAARDSYPTRPVRFLVPYPPGAGTDTAARTLGAKLAERWNQQVVVDNRGGASGVVGVETAVNANPDGHTIVLITNSQALGEATGIKLPYNLVKDLQPVTHI